MEASTATTLLDDDPWIYIRHDDYPAGSGWKIQRSKLTRHSGFFRRMFKHDCVETRTNEVTLHDESISAVDDMLKCIVYDKMYFTASRGCASDPDAWNTFELHEDVASLYQLMDKYDCAEFKEQCRQILADQVKFCIDGSAWGSWGDSELMEHHYEELASWYGGEYPEGLYPVLAEVWRKFAAMDIPCPKLDAIIEGNPALVLAIAKSYRTKLNLVEDNVAATKEALETSV